MSNPNQLFKKLTMAIIASFVVFATLAGFWLYAGNTSARAGSPPPDLPQFDGTSVTQVFPLGHSPERTAAPAPRFTNAGWEVIFDEDWESGFDNDVWLTLDRNGGTGGEYKWGVREVENPLGGGTQSAWSIGGGLDGQNLDVETDGYPGQADSWLIAGPIDLSEAFEAELSFNYWFEADTGDVFAVLVSSDGITWEGKQTDDGGTGQWLGRNYSLDTYLGQPAVYLAFQFASNENGDNNKRAAFVDDIEVRANYGSVQYLPHVQVQPTPTPTLTPSPTPTIPSSGPFVDNFTNNISGWEARRARNGAIYALNHRGDTDGGRQGVMEMILDTEDGFVIASPLIAAKEPPYNIEFYAKLKEPADRHMYGAVFGADWNGGNCAAPSSPNCFNRYYELRVQYRDFEGKRFQELKLKRIDSHDANGEPVGPTLIDFKKGGNVGTDDWIEIDILVAADGRMRISWNDKFIGEAQDDELISQPYFGLLLITKENDDARVKFDYIKID